MKNCISCDKPISDHDDFVRIVSEDGHVYYHLECWKIAEYRELEYWDESAVKERW